MNIVNDEREKYDELWSAVPAYGADSPGERYVPVLLDAAGPGRLHVLDAGCGSGKGSLALEKAGYVVTCCDFTDSGLTEEARKFPFVNACLWKKLPGKYDWVFCTDVLEHLPPQFTMLAVEQMLRVARRGLVLSVCLAHDNFGVWTGKPLHQTVQSFVWWRDSLREVGEVTDARDLHIDACFVVRSKR